jgi:hypothetical protein
MRNSIEHHTTQHRDQRDTQGAHCLDANENNQESYPEIKTNSLGNNHFYLTKPN